MLPFRGFFNPSSDRTRYAKAFKMRRQLIIAGLGVMGAPASHAVKVPDKHQIAPIGALRSVAKVQWKHPSYLRRKTVKEDILSAKNV